MKFSPFSSIKIFFLPINSLAFSNVISSNKLIISSIFKDVLTSQEDIGLGNPNIGPRVYAATEAALSLGLPEARLPLAYAVVELACSPKSNSTYKAINEALSDLENLNSMSIPPHILNKELKSGKYEYKYPHDYPNDYVKQQYMPDELLGKVYYEPKDTGSYERAIKEFMKKLKETD